MSQPIRILHLRASNFVGGPEKQLLNHAKTERNGLFEIILGTFVGKKEGRDFLEASEKLGIPSLGLPDYMLGRNGALSAIVRVLQERKIALLCTHGYEADVLGTLAARWARIPVVWFLRGWTGENWKVRTYEALDRVLLPLATRIVCLSITQAKRLSRRRTLKDRLRVVPNSVDCRDISSDQRAFARHQICASFQIPEDSSIVATAGRLSPEKGASFLLQAVPEILEHHPATHFILFGDGALKGILHDLTAKMGITSQVHFAGFMPNFRELLPGINILVNPSLSEEMPNVVLEGMAAELPIVATDVGGVSEIAGAENAMEVVPPGQPSAIAYAVVGLLNAPGRAAALGERALQRVQRAFSAAGQSEAMHALYVELLLGGTPRPISYDFSASVLKPANQSAQEKGEANASLPFISLVIPVRNEEEHLGLVLQGLLNQNYPRDRYELLVVDGNSSDRTARVAGEAGRNSVVPIRLLSNPSQLSSAGRNVGVRNSSGELIVFVDGHCHIPSRELLRDTAQLFAATGADCLCRPQPLTAPGTSAFQKVVADVRASVAGHGLDSTIFSADLEGYVNPTSSGASYRRSVFEQIGMYDEQLDACEDVEFNYRVFRAGLRAYISPRLTIQYQPRTSIVGLWKQMVRYGKGRYRFAEIHPEAISVTQAIPALFVLWVLFGGIAALISSFFAPIYFSTLGVYGGIVLASSIWLGMQHGWRHLILAPGAYTTIHLGLGFGFLTEAMQSLRRRLSSRLATAAVEKSPFVSTEASPSLQVQMHLESIHVSASDEGCSEFRKSEQQGLASHADNRIPTVNAFTVDVEDYFQTEAMTSAVSREQWDQMPSRVQRNTYRLLEVLASHNVRGTFFFLGWVAERFPGLVREAVQLGHEVGCHSFWHRRISCLSPSEFRSDTLRAKHTIENAGGSRVRGYRAPSFSMVPGTEWAADLLAELGFDYDSSVHPIRHDLYSNASAPRAPHRISDGAILELPVATTRWGNNNLPIGGGGYFRILPYSYTRWGLSRFNRMDARPAVFYLHPWEIDPQQPRLGAPLSSSIRQYMGLANVERKLTTLLKDFQFAPISTVFGKELEECLPTGSSSIKEIAESEDICS